MKNPPDYDLNVNVGVPGWRVDGRMLRLVDVLRETGNFHHLEDHRRALILLRIAYSKLQDELREAEEVFGRD